MLVQSKVASLLPIIDFVFIHQFTNRSSFASTAVTDAMRARVLIANIILISISIIYFSVLGFKNKNHTYCHLQY
jgi:hypothetical protein